MPGPEFLALWDAGKIDPSVPVASDVIMMLPFAR
jgi:hypothetical protein